MNRTLSKMIEQARLGRIVAQRHNRDCELMIKNGDRLTPAPCIETLLYAVAGLLIGLASCGVLGSNNAPDQVAGSSVFYHAPTQAEIIASAEPRPLAP
jgi:hypothetical protein